MTLYIQKQQQQKNPIPHVDILTIGPAMHIQILYTQFRKKCLKLKNCLGHAINHTSVLPLRTDPFFSSWKFYIKILFTLKNKKTNKCVKAGEFTEFIKYDWRWNTDAAGLESSTEMTKVMIMMMCSSNDFLEKAPSVCGHATKAPPFLIRDSFTSQFSSLCSICFGETDFLRLWLAVGLKVTWCRTCFWLPSLGRKLVL